MLVVESFREPLMSTSYTHSPFTGVVNTIADALLASSAICWSSVEAPSGLKYLLSVPPAVPCSNAPLPSAGSLGAGFPASPVL